MGVTSSRTWLTILCIKSKNFTTIGRVVFKNSVASKKTDKRNEEEPNEIAKCYSAEKWGP